MGEATQDEGKAALGALVSDLSAQLSGIFPGLDCAVVFWNRGEHEDRLRNVVYATAEAFPDALAAMETAIRATREASSGLTLHGLDTPERVCFYEQEFYPLSNFSAFNLPWKTWWFDTVEHAYHWEKFIYTPPTDAAAPGAHVQAFKDRLLVADRVRTAPSAHTAFQIAQENKALRRVDWDDVKVDVMRNLLRAKVHRHEYVRRKLLQTGDRELVENSWRDGFWGWGPNRDGQNMLGKLWMEIRAELRKDENA